MLSTCIRNLWLFLTCSASQTSMSIINVHLYHNYVCPVFFTCREQALSQLYIEDKKLLSNLAYSFLNELSTTFSLFVQHLSQQLVAAEIKDKLWKEEVECLAKDAFSDAKKRWLSVSLSAMGRAKMSIPNTLQVDLVSDYTLSPCFNVDLLMCVKCPVTVQLLEHICKTLEDREPTNEKMVNSKC